jgi:YHS domain-containing protein
MRILIILALLVILFCMLKGLVQPRRGGENHQRSDSTMGWGKGNELVRDPYCQTYVPIDTAFHAKVGGKDLFFCSKRCMNRYLRENKARASEIG